jgi:hypothetical protein
MRDLVRKANQLGREKDEDNPKYLTVIASGGRTTSQALRLSGPASASQFLASLMILAAVVGFAGSQATQAL